MWEVSEEAAFLTLLLLNFHSGDLEPEPGKQLALDMGQVAQAWGNKPGFILWPPTGSGISVSPN